MVKAEVKVALDVEEDAFEEFEVRNKGQQAMTDEEEVPEKKVGMFDLEEQATWDDDDIDNTFAHILKQELKFQDPGYYAPVGYNEKSRTQKSRAMQEAELDAREAAVAREEFALLQRKKALDGLTEAMRNPNAKAAKKIEDKLLSSKKEVDKLLHDILQEELGNGPIEEKYESVAANEYATWKAQMQKKSTAVVYDLMERERLIKEREISLKSQKEQLETMRTKMRRTRRSSISMFLPNATPEQLAEKETEESSKVLRVRQLARRRASITAIQDAVKGKGMAEAQKLLEQAAVSVAQAEEHEEHEILGEEEEDTDTPASPRSSRTSSNLPYHPKPGNAIDNKVAEVLNNNQIDMYIKFVPTKHKHKRGGKKAKAHTKNMYRVGSGEKIMVRVVHRVAVASLASGPPHWVPLLQLLKQIQLE